MITIINQRHWNGYFARYDGQQVTVYKYWWMPQYLYDRFVIPHEKGHLSGIPATGCLGRHLWCVMAEEHLVGFKDGTFLGKLILLPLQLIIGRGRYCIYCDKAISTSASKCAS